MNVAVLVVGDVGRSPRMNYQTLSLANALVGERSKAPVHVDLVGYGGSKPRQEVLDHRNISLHHITAFPNWFPRVLMPIYAPFKVLWLLLQLFWILMFCIKPPKAILVQNPPAIPALLVAWMVCRMRGAKLVIDWHNFGYTILQCGLGHDHFLVSIYQWYEGTFGPLGDAHFCVSKAMKETLKRQWGIDAVVLYDRAPSFFKKLSPSEIHMLFVELQDEFEDVASQLGVSLGPDRTLFTTASAVLSTCDDGSSEDCSQEPANEGEITDVRASLAPSRPALIVSSTSWTPDEDFGVLLEALDLCERKISTVGDAFPQMVFVITGKGEQKAHYQAEIAKRVYKNTHIRTMWLSAENYPKLLGAADLGISLHTSSSGVDLPMKVVDMFGAGLPVCAIGFKCLSELVRHEENGLVFEGSLQLADQLYDLLADFPSSPALERLSSNAQSTTSWEENWRENALPVFEWCVLESSSC